MKNKLQSVHFDTIDDFFEYLPAKEKKVVDFLRYLLLESIPNCTEKLSYNVPYYYRYSRICYIWPASVPWGNVKMDGVQLGFCQGYLLNDDIMYLERGSRKQVYVKTFSNVSDIDKDLVRYYLFNAVEVDETLRKKRS